MRRFSAGSSSHQQPPTSPPPPPARSASARHSVPTNYGNPPPPAYTVQSPPIVNSNSSPTIQHSVVPATPPARRNSVEDPLKGLSRFDCVFLVDDSPSMLPLWNECRDALRGIVQVATKYDKDGVDLYFMNNEYVLENCASAAAVDRVFAEIEPEGSTPTAMRLDDLLRPYIEACEDAKTAKEAVPRARVVVVLTDGQADDEDGVVDVIVEMAQRLDAARLPPFQLGLQFMQIGSDPAATEFLRKLDDDLKEMAGIRDMVDTRGYSGTMTSELILQVLLGSVNRRIDAQ